MTADPRQPEPDFLDTHGRAVHRFALDMANLGTTRLADALTAMLESGSWREFKDGLGAYRFLPGEFDYFLSQQGVDRDQVMLGVRDVALKANLEAAMDERRTGTDEYRRRLEEVRKANPKRPGRPIVPYGYSEREAKVLVEEGRLPQTGHRPPLGPAARRFIVTGGKTSVAAAKQAPLVERLGRSAKRLSDEELEQLIATLRGELRQRRQR
jgi:hypothetical protein